MESKHGLLLMSRVIAGDGSVSSQHLYSSYSLECIESGHERACSQREFSETVQYLFPDMIKKKTKNIDKTVTTFYVGIQLKPLEPLMRSPDNVDCSTLVDYIPEIFIIDSVTNELLVCKYETQYSINGHKVYIFLHFHSDYKFSVHIADKNVDLKSIGVFNEFTCSKESIVNICNTIIKLRLCCGVTVTTSVICSRFHTLENLKNKITEESSRQLRSVMCHYVTKFNAVTTTCIRCQRMTFKRPSTSDDTENVSPKSPSIKKTNDAPQQVSKEDIKKLVPSAPDNMIEMLLSQVQNANRSPKGRRWSKEIINSCLQIYSRNPHVYKLIRDSNLLVLPSTNLLISYKNLVKQEVGFSDEIFRSVNDFCESLILMCYLIHIK